VLASGKNLKVLVLSWK